MSVFCRETGLAITNILQRFVFCFMANNETIGFSYNYRSVLELPFRACFFLVQRMVVSLFVLFARG
jgi:hypothetical protein